MTKQRATTMPLNSLLNDSTDSPHPGSEYEFLNNDDAFASGQAAAQSPAARDGADVYDEDATALVGVEDDDDDEQQQPRPRRANSPRGMNALLNRGSNGKGANAALSAAVGDGLFTFDDSSTRARESDDDDDDRGDERATKRKRTDDGYGFGYESASVEPERSSAAPERTSSGSAPPVHQHQHQHQLHPAYPQQQQQQKLAEIEKSIFLVEPIDEFTREVADWLKGFAVGIPNIEIEAKIGMLLDVNTGDRVVCPVPTEAILMDDSSLRFVSNMTTSQHKHYNALLNSRVEESADPAYAHSKVRYAHTREIDSMHPDRHGNVRVTRDQKTGALKRDGGCVRKTRLADMNVYCPKRCFDWRLSVSTEEPVDVPSTPASHQRSKDRITYTHQLFRVDLTQVQAQPVNRAPGAPPGEAKTTHELEVEFKDSRILLKEAERESRGDESARYLEMVQAFLNNIRLLIRNAPDPDD